VNQDAVRGLFSKKDAVHGATLATIPLQTIMSVGFHNGPFEVQQDKHVFASYMLHICTELYIYVLTSAFTTKNESPFNH